MIAKRVTPPSQLGLGLNLSTKKTRKREFLDEMDRVVPWRALVQIVEPHSPRAKVHTVVGTAASVSDINVAGALLHGEEHAAFGDSGYQGVTLYPNQYRPEVETSGSSDIAVAACRQQRRAKSAGVAHPSAEWGRLSL